MLKRSLMYFSPTFLVHLNNRIRDCCFFLHSQVWNLHINWDNINYILHINWDNTSIEKTHLKFCRRYLEISNKASNGASRSELGRFPLIINIYKNILYYILYLCVKTRILLLNKPFVLR